MQPTVAFHLHLLICWTLIAAPPLLSSAADHKQKQHPFSPGRGLLPSHGELSFSAHLGMDATLYSISFQCNYNGREKKLNLASKLFALYGCHKCTFACFSRWRWCCLLRLCTRRRLLTCSHLLSALPTTTCTLCNWSPWLMCCRSSCLLKVQKVGKESASFAVPDVQTLVPSLSRLSCCAG